MTKMTPRTLEPRQYCVHLLRMNPLYDAARVLAVRRESLGLKITVSTDAWTWSRATPEERETVERNLMRLREVFWSMPLDSLKTQLEAIDVRRMPEFQPVVARLRLVASCRSEFPRLVAEPATDKTLFNAFKSAAVASPHEAGPIKETFLRSLNDPKQYPKAIQTAKRIRTAHPLLYQLERDWFETILGWKKPRRKIEIGIETPDFDLSHWASPSILFIIVILLRILMVAMR